MFDVVPSQRQVIHGVIPVSGCAPCGPEYQDKQAQNQREGRQVSHEPARHTTDGLSPSSAHTNRGHKKRQHCQSGDCGLGQQPHEPQHEQQHHVQRQPRSAQQEGRKEGIGRIEASARPSLDQMEDAGTQNKAVQRKQRGDGQRAKPGKQNSVAHPASTRSIRPTASPFFAQTRASISNDLPFSKTVDLSLIRCSKAQPVGNHSPIASDWITPKWPFGIRPRISSVRRATG